MKTPKTFTAITRQYFYPELKVCPHCGQRLRFLPGLETEWRLAGGRLRNSMLQSSMCSSACELHLNRLVWERGEAETSTGTPPPCGRQSR